jgi:hypothetical protein
LKEWHCAHERIPTIESKEVPEMIESTVFALIATVILAAVIVGTIRAVVSGVRSK